MRSPTVLPSRTITFRPDLGVMVVRWHTHTTFEIMQADYAQMLAAAAGSGFANWLLDVRRRDEATVERSAWISQDFYPEAVAQFSPHRLRVAVLNSPALTEAFRTNPELRQHVAYNTDPTRPYDIRLFADEGKAMSWLNPLLG